MDNAKAQLTEAAQLWVGKGTRMYPQLDDSAVISRFGAEHGAGLLGQLKVLYDDFYTSKANLKVQDLVDMGKLGLVPHIVET